MKKFLFGLGLCLSSSVFACTAYIAPQGEGEVKNFAANIYADEIYQHLERSLTQKGYMLTTQPEEANYIFENVVTICAQDVSASDICPHAVAVLDYASTDSAGNPDAGSYTGAASNSFNSQMGQREAAFEAIDKIRECHN
ncbi:MAG: hypothetical protein CME62_01250 [Halobacteriovoraceae bacterium]|nr:hypothetical protein [Halobacteriovoraceae bacterium]|tara:strand:+ start:482 stop:901 length:420 start_codon:yes stop_codon:yes gene_type:complete